MRSETPDLNGVAATPPVGRDVIISPPPGTSRSLHGYLTLADVQAAVPGILVIHEIFGLNDHIRDVAARFSREGYAALAVDLFAGSPRPLCFLRIFYGLLVRPLANGTVAELQGALQYLRDRPEVDADRVGVIGFCMGGGYALQLACVDGDTKAAAIFYGQNPRPLDAVARACPIVGSYPERDFTARQARTLEQALTRHQVPHDIKIYPEARHSFFNDTRGRHDPEAAADSWRRSLDFFQQHLGGPG